VNEKLQEFLTNSLQHDVDEVAVFEVPTKKNLFLQIGLVLFAISVIVFILDLILGWAGSYIIYVIIAFILFVVLPFGANKENKYDTIIVTPKYLIQRQSRTLFSAIEFDQISSFAMTQGGIIIKGQNQTIALRMTMKRDEMDAVLKILEAKGKTFDPEKEYLVRPVDIIIHDNTITLVDVHTENAFDRLYQQFTAKYKMLTPGFLDSIIFRNSNVTLFKQETEDSLSLGFDRLEIKEGHPENTKFESIFAQDCILIFHNPKLTRALLKNLHDKEEANKDLVKSIDEITNNIQSAVVNEWKLNPKSISFILSAGVHTMTLGIGFDDVIVGWNSAK
jgi:hypothetical protein